MCQGILNRPESGNPGTNQQFPYLIGIKLYLCVRQSSIESSARLYYCVTLKHDRQSKQKFAIFTTTPLRGLCEILDNEII